MSERLFEATVPVGAGGEGEWLLVPSCVFTSGATERGAAVKVRRP